MLCGTCGALEALSRDSYMDNLHIFPNVFFVKNIQHPPHVPQYNEISGLNGGFRGRCGSKAETQ